MCPLFRAVATEVSILFSRPLPFAALRAFPRFSGNGGGSLGRSSIFLTEGGVAGRFPPLLAHISCVP